MNGELPEWWLKDKMFMQYVWNTLTKDRASHWADYEWWVRINSYNQGEISYWEHLLKDAMDKEYKANPFVDRLWAYNSAMKKVLSESDYDNVKKMLSNLWDAWTPWKQMAYLDWLANAHWSTNMTWVKWLAIASEYRKLEIMKQYWLKYKGDNAYTSSEKELRKQLPTMQKSQKP
jgi:GTP1/Obg family GTP-binding protein